MTNIKRLTSNKQVHLYNRQSNYDRLLNYKSTTIPRLKMFYKYSGINEIDDCLILQRYFMLEQDINPFKEQDKLFNYMDEHIKEMNERRFKQGKETIY